MAHGLRDLRHFSQADGGIDLFCAFVRQTWTRMASPASMRAPFRHSGGAAPNLLAVTDTCLAWSAGVCLLAQPGLALNAAGGC
jgi:hypothetical protein